jgi:hypothetical protein
MAKLSAFTNPAIDFLDETPIAPRPTSAEIRTRYAGRTCLVTFSNGAGKSATGAVLVRCKVTEVAVTFGNVRVRVTPTDGAGSMLVDANKLGPPE